MAPDKRCGRLWDCVWFLAFAAASSVWCVTASRQLGATFDEPVYLQRGLEHWRTGSSSGLIRMGTMPLAADVQTLPIYVWERWHGVQVDPLQDWEQLIPWARAGTLVFWWLLLFYAGRTGSLLAGAWAGRLAIAVLACEPSLLAHAGLATTDIAISACLLAFVYHFRAGRDAGWLRRVGLPAFWFGAAVLAKASGLVFGGICLVVLEVERLARQGSFHKDVAATWRTYCRHIWNQTTPMRRDLVQIVAGGMLLTFLYCGCDWQAQPSFVAWAHGLPEGAGKQIAVWSAEHLRIFSNAGEGIVRQVKHNLHGHGAFLLGRSEPRSLWYYFPVLLTIKLTAPLLVAPLALLLLHPRAMANWAFLTSAVLVLFSFTWHVQIGVRLVLPVVVLAVVGVTAAVVNAWHASPGLWKRRLVALGSGAGVVWAATAALLVWPHGLCYVNEFWGGTAQGYRLVSDANYDWGQGLPELTYWQQQHGLERLDVWYFGTDPTVIRRPLQVIPFHVLPIQKPEDVLPYVRGRLLAVGTTLQYGAPGLTEAHRQAAALLATRRPVARTTTFLIYDFTQDARASISTRE
ncbi:MAG TPA: hypothetical protein VG099_19530 [Gemmataceae bacterium]|nr:hypothetical protein [Gemmataceae bacterium]